MKQPYSLSKRLDKWARKQCRALTLASTTPIEKKDTKNA